MKGMDPLEWLFVTMALTLIFLSFATSPIQGATEEAIATDARLAARRFASAINVIQTSPDGTTFIMDMPTSKCTLKITDRLVDLKIAYISGQEISETVGIIKTPTIIAAPEEFECKTTRKIKMEKNNGVLEIKRV